jgi:hypothetical protein
MGVGGVGSLQVRGVHVTGTVLYLSLNKPVAWQHHCAALLHSMSRS